MSKGFQFKQFFIAHDHCAMKVNTDGILLGSLAPIAHLSPRGKILDLGTGTGLVAMMLAQRQPKTTLFAVELEPNAYAQAVENIHNSPWQERIHLLQGDVLQLNFPKEFDLIVANPPYFEQSLRSRNPQRDLARSTEINGHLAWLQQSAKWLAPQGIISFILPTEMAEKLIKQAPTSGLFCQEICYIHAKANHPPKRAVVNFRRYSQPSNPQSLPEVTHLTIYDEQNQYTAEFKALTQAFYLNF
ncbi:tRNA (adenine-N(6)-)-methyltransferase [Pasteurellaceae bacterium Macca]|nr:tRNA (adenine-N(6)-)-methyltransferase [Pasteurellaceae bacterium Macca]